MDGTNVDTFELMRLHCQECDQVSDEAARGWRTLLACDPDEPEAGVMLATYCPRCAAREFGFQVGEQATRRGL
jgi:hypothetical protein